MKLSAVAAAMLILAACAASAPSYAACLPTCSCQASYNGGICHADYGPCPNGTCAACSCSSDKGCAGGCFPGTGGGSGGGGGSCAAIGHCLMWLSGDSLSLTGLVEFIAPHVPPGWTIALVGEDDGARATFAGEWTVEEALRLHYGRRLELDEGRKVARIGK